MLAVVGNFTVIPMSAILSFSDDGIISDYSIHSNFNYHTYINITILRLYILSPAIIFFQSKFQHLIMSLERLPICSSCLRSWVSTQYRTCDNCRARSRRHCNRPQQPFRVVTRLDSAVSSPYGVFFSCFLYSDIKGGKTKKKKILTTV